MKINNFDTLPNNVQIFDEFQKPSYMVRIPKFRICDVLEGGSQDTHPAFIIGDKEVPEIYISKYPNVIHDNAAYSLPNMVPTTGLTRNQIRDYCSIKGSGWHQMTNAEWAAVALWSKKNNTMPHGNNNFSRDFLFPHETAVVGSTYENSKGVICDGKTITATGPITWSHNHSSSGIYDLNGNVWTQVAGFRIYNGIIQITKNNDSSLINDDENIEEDWWYIRGDGEYVKSLDEGVFKFDNQKGKLLLTTGDNKIEDSWCDCLFSKLRSNENVPQILKALAIFPNGNGYGEQKIWVNNHGLKYPWRGGTWDAYQFSGIFCLFICYHENHLSQWSGFRVSYIDIKN